MSTLHNVTLQYSRVRIESDLEVLRNYIIESATLFDTSKQEFIEKIEEEKNKVSPDDWSEMWEFYEDEYYMQNEFFPNLLYSSSLTSVYSIYEYSLNNLCETFGKILSHKLKPKEIASRNYVGRSFIYLDKVIGVNVNSVNIEKQYLINLQELRNKMVHNDGNIWVEKDKPLNEQRLYPFVNTNASLKLKDNGEVFIINSAIIVEAIDKVEAILKVVLNELKSKSV